MTPRTPTALQSLLYRRFGGTEATPATVRSRRPSMFAPPSGQLQDEGGGGMFIPPNQRQGDNYLRDEMGDDEYNRYMQMTPQQQRDYMADPQNGFAPPVRDNMIQENPASLMRGAFNPNSSNAQVIPAQATAGSFSTSDNINMRRAEEEEMNARSAMSRLSNISDMIESNPELVESLTWDGNMKRRVLELRDKTGFDFLEISPEEERYLTDSTVFRQNILRNINRTIQEVTGAQMGEQEAQRIRAEMPDVTAGPVEFKAKLSAAMDMIRLDAARFQLWKNGGGAGEAKDISDQQVKDALKQRGAELYQQFIQQGDNPADARLKASQALSREFGL